MYNILIVSENCSPFEALEDYLKHDFLSVYYMDSKKIHEGINEYKKYDFILLHLLQNEHQNKEMIQHIKQNTSCPMYVFGQSFNEETIALYLSYGSEGYVEIPFHAKLVAAHIKSVLRFLHQVKRGLPTILRFGRLTFLVDNHELILDGKHIQLTNVEFKIFQLLLENRESVVTKDSIIHHVWDENSSATDNALGIHVTRLRKKIKCDSDQDLIETIWGLGYRLNLALCEKSSE